MAERAAGRILSLPLFPAMSHAQQDQVAGLIHDFYRQRPQYRAEGQAICERSI
jgi:dTDP-4-amino-4,6-dideoxygalactose transaminase